MQMKINIYCKKLTELENDKDEIQLNSSSGLLRSSFPFQGYP